MSTAICTKGRQIQLVVAILAYAGHGLDREALVMYRDGTTQWRMMRYMDVCW